MKAITGVKMLVLSVALSALFAAGCRCCDDYRSRSYSHETLPPTGVEPHPSLTSAQVIPE